MKRDLDLTILAFCVLLMSLTFVIGPVSCGGGGASNRGTNPSPSPQPPNAITAILNGPSYLDPTTTAVWISSACLGQSLFVITSDGTITGIWKDACGVAGDVQGTWTPTADGTGLLIRWGGQCFPSYLHPYPVSILDIQGSTSSGTLACQVVDDTGNASSCSFELVPFTSWCPNPHYPGRSVVNFRGSCND